jgi:NADH-quinone oxidoreductase subunit J
MTVAFYTAAAVAIVATFMVVTRLNAIHALLYFVVSLLAAALILLLLGAPFAAAMEVIIYAGAIMVLFVFVVMILSAGPREASQERQRLRIEAWIGPAILCAVLLGELLYVMAGTTGALTAAGQVTPAQVGASLLGPYLLGVELVSMLLLVGLIGAFHLAYRLGKGEASEEAGGKR